MIKSLPLISLLFLFCATHVSAQEKNFGIRNHEGNYLTFNSGVIEDNHSFLKKEIGKLELYNITFLEKNLIAIKTPQNKYFCTDKGFFGEKLEFNRDQIGDWEKYEIIAITPTKFRIRSYSGSYLYSSRGHLSLISNANKEGIFEFVNLDGSTYKHGITITNENIDPTEIFGNIDGKRLYKKGDLIRLPIKSGMDENVLGFGFDENMRQTTKEVNDKPSGSEKYSFGLKVEKIEDEFMNNAEIGFSFFNYEKKTSSKSRSMTLSSCYENFIKSIQIPSKYYENNTKVIAKNIIYGWTIDFKLTSSSIKDLEEISTMANNKDNGLNSMLSKYMSNIPKGTIGNSSSNETEKFEYKIRGLKLKSDNSKDTVSVLKHTDLFNEKEITNNFEQPKTHQPIFVEFEVVDDFVSNKIDWVRPKITNGNILLKSITLKSKARKPDGRDWDKSQKFPDAYICLYQKKNLIWKSRIIAQGNAITFGCDLNLFIDNQFNIQIDAWDDDHEIFAGNDDLIGKKLITYKDLHEKYIDVPIRFDGNDNANSGIEYIELFFELP